MDSDCLVYKLNTEGGIVCQRQTAFTYYNETAPLVQNRQKLTKWINSVLIIVFYTLCAEKNGIDSIYQRGS